MPRVDSVALLVLAADTAHQSLARWITRAVNSAEERTRDREINAQLLEKSAGTAGEKATLQLYAGRQNGTPAPFHDALEAVLQWTH